MSTITVGKCLKDVISMGEDVTILKMRPGTIFKDSGSYDVLVKHSKHCMTDYDVPYEIQQKPILSVGLHKDFPNEIVIFT